MNTTTDSSLPPAPRDEPSREPEPAASKRKPVAVLFWTVLIMGVFNYFLFRAFSPSTKPQGVTVASFRADFQPDKPKEGWRYLWNASGPIGHATNYAELRWNGTIYVADDLAPFPNPPPARHLRIDDKGGHPGQGPAQGSRDEEIGAIAAFTLPESGRYWLTNSLIVRWSGQRRGNVQLRVFVNDVETGPQVYCNSREGLSFDRALGTLSAGDTIYVVVGPNETDVEDGFELDFSIAR